jgi:hypothetical protein
MVLSRRNALLGLGAVFVVGCKVEGGGRVERNDPPTPVLDVRHALLHDTLQLEYRVTNSLSVPIFLFDILHREFDGSVYPLDPGAYVEISGHDVVVSRKLFPVPDNMLVEQPNIPFSTRLLPGQVSGGLVKLRTPLKSDDPYRENAAGEGAVVGRRLFFEIGYFEGAPGTEGTGRAFPTSDGNRHGFEVFDAALQKLVRVGPLGTFLTAGEEAE